jgi:hypothetical protein
MRSLFQQTGHKEIVTGQPRGGNLERSPSEQAAGQIGSRSADQFAEVPRIGGLRQEYDPRR